MIQANELRIGNYIYDDFKEIYKVERIESEKYNEWNGGDPSLVVFSKLNTKHNGMYTCDVIYGIPITEDTLLKCGYRLTNPIVMAFEKPHHQTLYLWAGGVRMSTGITMKYLHQLQNREYSMNGRELEINL